MASIQHGPDYDPWLRHGWATTFQEAIHEAWYRIVMTGSRVKQHIYWSHAADAWIIDNDPRPARSRREEVPGDGEEEWD